MSMTVGIGFFSLFVFFFKQKTAYEMRISDWSSDVCSSDLQPPQRASAHPHRRAWYRPEDPPTPARVRAWRAWRPWQTWPALLQAASPALHRDRKSVV